MSTALDEIQALIDNGDTKRARQRLKPILQAEPSAQAWYLAALSVDDDMQKIKCLRQALKIDEFHSPANRLLHKVEGGMPLHEQAKQQQEELERRQQEVVPLEKIDREMKKDRFQRHAERQRGRTRLGCFFGFLLSTSCMLFAISAIGLLPGFVGTVTRLLGGASPVYDIDGTPVQDRDDALLVVTPSQRNEASNQDVDIMDHGYLHEYQFYASTGKSYAVFVQFLSVNANHVSRNVGIFDAENYDVTSTCERDRIFEGDNGIAYICKATIPGQWSVRILGITGESVGAYFVGVESLAY